MASFPLLDSKRGDRNAQRFAGAAYFSTTTKSFMSEVATDIAFAMEVNAALAGAAQTREEELRATQMRFSMLAENVHEVVLDTRGKGYWWFMPRPHSSTSGARTFESSLCLRRRVGCLGCTARIASKSLKR